MVSTRGAAAAVVFGILVACVDDNPGPSSTPDASSGIGAGEHTIRCNGAMCTGSDVCCVELSPGGNFLSGTCKARASCATTFFECDSKSDCPQGKVCCAKTNGGSYVWPGASCQSSCASPDRELCEEDAECSGGCTTLPSDLEPPNLKACAQ